MMGATLMAAAVHRRCHPGLFTENNAKIALIAKADVLRNVRDSLIRASQGFLRALYAAVIEIALE